MLMINALGKTLKDMVFNPFLLVPGILFVGLQALLYIVFFSIFDTVPNFIYDVLVLGSSLNAGFFDSLGAFFLVYPFEITVFSFLAVLWVAGYVWLLAAFTHFRENPHDSIFGAVSSSFSSVGKIIGLSVFLWILLALFVTASMAIVFLGIIFSGAQVAFILLLALFWLFGFLVYLKLLFLPIVFYSEKKRIREAVSLTVQWAKKKTIAIFLVILCGAIFYEVIAEAAISVADAIESETIAILVMFFALSVISTFSGTLMVNYYYSGK